MLEQNNNIELNSFVGSELKFELRLAGERAEVALPGSVAAKLEPVEEHFPTRVPQNTPEHSEMAAGRDSKIATPSLDMSETSGAENVDVVVAAQLVRPRPKEYPRIKPSKYYRKQDDAREGKYESTHKEGLFTRSSKRYRTDLSTKYSKVPRVEGFTKGYISPPRPDRPELNSTEESESQEVGYTSLKHYNMNHIHSGFLPTEDILTNYVEEYQVRIRRSHLRKQALISKNKRASRKNSLSSMEPEQIPSGSIITSGYFRDQSEEQAMEQQNLKDSFSENFMATLVKVCQENQSGQMLRSWQGVVVHTPASDGAGNWK